MLGTCKGDERDMDNGHVREYKGHIRDMYRTWKGHVRGMQVTHKGYVRNI
jgi:hypothetical protein